MIIRSSFKCLTCGQIHTVRIGIGQEDYQEHRFPCTACEEPMAIAVHLDFAKAGWKLEGLENAEFTPEVEGAKIVNVDANFIIPKEQRHADRAFPRLGQMHAMWQAAEKAGYILRPASLLNQQRPFRRPDFLAEWRLIKKAWSLRRNGHDKLSDRKRAEASETFYAEEPLDSFDDWLWRFLLSLCQPAFTARFTNAFAQIKPLLGTPEFGRFLAAYDALSAERGVRYFDLMRSYFSAYSDFSQVLFLITQGVTVPEADAASTINFDATCMFYGNAFEAFSSSVDILSYINNIIEGRPFGTFKTITREKYLTLDKASRCNAFAANPSFSALCGEFDNQIRNASHHGGFKLNNATQAITCRAGKGGIGEEQTIYYVSYLARSTTLFLQCMTLFQIEIMICSVTGRQCPF